MSPNKPFPWLGGGPMPLHQIFRGISESLVNPRTNYALFQQERDCERERVCVCVREREREKTDRQAEYIDLQT